MNKKNGNFRMECIRKGDLPYTIGKIYTVINGFWLDDNDEVCGEELIKTIDDVNAWGKAEWRLVTKESITDRTEMEKIAFSFNVGIGEKFNILTEKGTCSIDGPYHFTHTDLLDHNYQKADSALYKLVSGKYQIEFLPWKPEHKDVVWYIEHDGTIIADSFDETSAVCIALLHCGWYFRTKKEAKKNRDRVSKEMKEIIKNESN